MEAQIPSKTSEIPQPLGACARDIEVAPSRDAPNRNARLTHPSRSKGSSVTSFFKSVQTLHVWTVCALFALLLPLTPAHAGCSQDIDANGEITATTDGLLMARYMLGIRGSALTAGALGAAAARTAPADIEAYIAAPCLQAGWVGGGSGRLNDTGIQIGGEAISGNNPGCTGATIAQQDCSKGRDATAVLNSNTNGKAGFHFTKISNSGAPLPATATLGAGANDWACTYDNVTGLMWEVKTAAAGRRNQDHTYTWFSSDSSNNAGATGTANGGTCFDVGQCDTEKFAQLVNVVGLCGRNDWRMPHIKELESIVDFGVANPAIDSSYFPNTLASDFWSGSPYTGALTWAWVVNFSLGNAGFVSRNFANRVRLVRAGQ
jgi:Protein of unknown function (DUF1566)